MDGNNWMAAQAQAQGGGGEGAGAIDSGDWRTQLLPDSRQTIVNKIMETLKGHLPIYGQEGLQELKKIAVRFEENIYSAATSQQDYLRKISLKMLTMETKSQNPMTNSIQPNPASSGQGRKKIKRASSILERGSKKRKNKCSICKRCGHNRATCPYLETK